MPIDQPKSTLKHPSRRHERSIGLALTGVVLLLYFLGLPLLEVLELKTYDQRVAAHAQRIPHGDVVIAAIDEKSLAALGRWPWSRATMAQLLQRLDRLHPRVVAFDIFFSEAENQTALQQIERLEATQGFANNPHSPYIAAKRALAVDSIFSDAVAQSGHVVLAEVFLMAPDEAAHTSPSDQARAFAAIEPQAIQVIKHHGTGAMEMKLPQAAGVIVNLPELARRARYIGHINSIADSDGTVRSAPLTIPYRGLFFPSADVQAARLYRNDAPLALRTNADGVTALELGTQAIATDEAGRVLIRYHGPARTFRTLSIADIFAGRVAPDSLRDKIVVVGATAQGIGDIRATPFGASYPGVEIRANTIQNILDNDFNYRPAWMSVVDALTIIGLGLALTLALPRVDVRYAALITIGAMATYLALVTTLFRTQHVWLNVVYPSLTVLLLFIATTITKYFYAESDKRRIKGAFAHYVPAPVVEQIVADIDRLALGGEKRVLTVLFSDIRGFTGMAETLPPEELVRLLNVYLTQMTDKVFAHEGLLDKYIGDAIMAVYGAPIARNDHALAACRTAVDMLRTLHRLQGEWQRQGVPTIDIGVGINTGPMVVGNMGSANRFNYTVIGDAVNLASRIEGLNKTYGTHILISEYTYREVKDEFPHLREIDHVQVRGRQEPVRIYEIMLAEHYGNIDWLPQFDKAYGLFQTDRHAEAAPLFLTLAQTANDPVSRYYLQRCRPQ